MNGSITIDINLGNEACRNMEDVVETLRKASDKMLNGERPTRLMDNNGNVIGGIEYDLETERIEKNVYVLVRVSVSYDENEELDGVDIAEQLDFQAIANRYDNYDTVVEDTVIMKVFAQNPTDL